MTPLEVMQEYAWRLVGLPYLWGGDDTIYGFDCSGLAQEILSSVGEDPPGDQTAQAYYDHFKLRARYAKAELGALAFYGKSATRITHVGFCLNSLCFIEAGGGDATTTSVAVAAAQNAFIRPRKITYRSDLVSVLRPIYTFEMGSVKL